MGDDERFFSGEVVSDAIHGIALVALLALMTVSYLLGRATVDRPDPDVYVVHDTELTTTTVAP